MKTRLTLFFALALAASLTLRGGSACAADRKLSMEAQIRLAKKELELKNALYQAHMRYSDSHPHIKALQAQIDYYDGFHLSPRALAAARTQLALQQKRDHTSLEDQRADLEVEIADAHMRYSDNHPAMIKLRQQIADLDQQIHARNRK